MRQRIALFTLAGLSVVLVLLVLGTGPALPARVATHFGMDGLPNGWMSREAFMRSIVVIVILPVVLLQGIGFLLGRLPTSLINLPNREYWLAPERRAKTLAHIRTSMLEFGNATFAFLIFVVWSVIEANTANAETRLGNLFAYGLFTFLAFVAVWTFSLVRPYLRVPDGA